MKQVLSIACASMFAWATCGCHHKHLSEGQSSDNAVRALNSVFDAGTFTLPNHKTVEAVFCIHNGAHHDVEIARIRTSCGCLVVDGYDATIHPDRDNAITLQITAPLQPGGFEQHAVVEFVEAKASPIVLKVIGQVEATGLVCAFPASVDFGEIDSTELPPGLEPPRQTIEVCRYDGGAFEIDTVKADVSWVQLEVLPRIAAQRTQTVLARLTPRPQTGGVLDGHVSIYTKHLTDPLIVPLHATIRTPADLLVDSILLTNVVPGDFRELTLWKTGVLPDRMSAVESMRVEGSPYLQVQRTSKPGIFGIVVAHDAKGRVARGTLVIALTNCSEKVRLPIVVVFRQNPS